MTIVDFDFILMQVANSHYKNHKFRISMVNFLYIECLEETKAGVEAAAYVHLCHWNSQKELISVHVECHEDTE